MKDENEPAEIQSTRGKFEPMLPASKVDWKTINPAENPSVLLLRECIATYVKVDREREKVYRYYRVPIGKDEDVGSLPFEGFHDELVFLRLGDHQLAEIAATGSCRASKFTDGGISIPRPYEIAGWTRGGYAIRKELKIEEVNMTEVDFFGAHLIDKGAWEWTLRTSAVRDVPVPTKFVMPREIRFEDLYVSSADVEGMMRAAQESFELVDYPFDHDVSTPGLYWMFQAACALTERHMIEDHEVLSWLRSKSPGKEFAGKRGVFAAKLIPLKVDRSKGRKEGPKPFKIDDLKNWEDNPDRYMVPFVSSGLSLALAVADWWRRRLNDDPNESRITLAMKLLEQNFDQTEVGHLVRLIAGVHLSRDEQGLFQIGVLEKSKREMFKVARETVSEFSFVSKPTGQPNRGSD